MKTATLPPLRVDPKLKKDIETVLRDDETLSSFMLDAIKKTAEARRSQQAFVELAEARARKAETTGRYVTADVVYRRVEQVIAKAKRRAAAK